MEYLGDMEEQEMVELWEKKELVDVCVSLDVRAEDWPLAAPFSVTAASV